MDEANCSTSFYRKAQMRKSSKEDKRNVDEKAIKGPYAFPPVPPRHPTSLILPINYLTVTLTLISVAFTHSTPFPNLQQAVTTASHSLANSHIPSLTHSFIHSLLHSLTPSLSHSLSHSFNRNHSLIHSLTHTLFDSLILSFIHSVTRSLTRLLTHSFIHSFTHLFTHLFLYALTIPLAHSLTHLFTHSL